MLFNFFVIMYKNIISIYGLNMKNMKKIFILLLIPFYKTSH
jgi:hypothetical protein